MTSCTLDEAVLPAAPGLGYGGSTPTPGALSLNFLYLSGKKHHEKHFRRIRLYSNLTCLKSNPGVMTSCPFDLII